MRHPLWLVVLVVLLQAGCGGSGPIEITEVREIDQTNDFEIPKLAESDASRFRFSAKKSSDPTSTSGSGSTNLSWDLPEGWKALPSTSMRDPNLTFGEDGEGQCYVTRLSGAAGGMDANVNRWRKQMGAENLTAEQVEALPKKNLFGQPATLISVDGPFSGMGGEPKENYRLLGLILNVADSMVTIKMTGPKDLVAENEAKFDAFCASLALKPGN